MKKISFLFLTLSAFILASCGSDDEGLVTLSQDLTLEEETQVDIPAGSSNTISVTESVELTSGDLDEIDDISDVTINSVKFIIKNYVGADGIQITSSTISILAANDDVIVSLILANASNPVNIKSFSDNGTVIEASSLTDDLLNQIATSFQENGRIKIKFDATFDDVPVAFDLESKINLTVEGTVI